MSIWMTTSSAAKAAAFKGVPPSDAFLGWIGPTFKQELHRRAGAVTAGRDNQGGLAISRARINIGPMAHQQPDLFRIFHRPHQRRSAGIVADVGISAVVEQHADRISV